ncbi:MAG: NADPH-dependent 7-cyano-7-deazaguanine reductase QueF [Pseudomonadales bacterium]|nr:NADPH-dependent 7-cyano-7-deazaguanine reductase QueF [Pseudomonadales bacterium]
MSVNPLGEKVPSPSKYDPGILYPIPRWPARSLLDIDKKLLMYGIDHWHAYELSWLNEKGKPEVALGEFFFNADSENIVESKSLKLYLNSFNQERFESREKLAGIIANDLSAVSKSRVTVELQSLGQGEGGAVTVRQGKSLDAQDIEISHYEPDQTLLKLDPEPAFDETVYSDLFKSNCPVTGQPDWASVNLEYSGTRINEASLLAYLCSFRGHQGYHEECAERIFRDLVSLCQPTELTLSMNYLRRGGLDINVYRSTSPFPSERIIKRLLRQ